MIRNLIRAGLLLLAGLAIPAAVLAGPLPAGAAAPSGHLCETFGSYCVGTDSLDMYTKVLERNPGRIINEISLGGSFEGHPTYLLQFAGNTAGCVASQNDLFGVDMRPCNGGTGTVWALVTSTAGHQMWLNRLATQSLGFDVYLSGHNNGTQYFLASTGTSGARQQFDLF